MTSTVDNLEGALRELGVKIAKVDDDEISGFCPNLEHDNVNTPAWSMRRTEKVVYRDGSRRSYPPGTFNCFSCGYKGDITLLVTDILGLDGFAGARWLRQFGVREIEEVPTWDELDRPFVLEYSPKNTVTEQSLMKFTEPTDTQCQSRNFTTVEAALYSILRDEKKDAWILPIRDKDEKLIGWQEKAPDYFRNYPAGVRKSNTLFGLHRVPQGSPVSLVESPLDVPRLRRAGYYAVASYGAGVSEEQMKLLMGVTDTIILALDNPHIDEAGRKKSEELRKLYGRRCNLFFWNYDGIDKKDPGAMDDDELEYGFTNRRHSLA